MLRPPGSGFGGRSNRDAESPRLDKSSQRNKNVMRNNCLDDYAIFCIYLNQKPITN